MFGQGLQPYFIILLRFIGQLDGKYELHALHKTPSAMQEEI